jgi:acetylornithine deacetylase/succinyl-diaminopimelate desuccinylase-like protein
VARLEGGDAPPLCLLSHIDVATVEAARWDQGHTPFSGDIDAEGRIWGRGALDMKGMGAIELMSLIWAKRVGLPLGRDVILLATADEEVDNRGAAHLASMWDELRCGYVINEGGLGLRGALFEGQDLFGISVAEKGALWLRMIASGEAGHGSTPDDQDAPARLVRALTRVASREARAKIPVAMYDLLARAGEDHGGVVGGILRTPWAVRAFVRPKLMARGTTAAVISDTVHVTGFGGAAEPNVVPSEVWAQLDCRLLPGSDPAELERELVALVDDSNVRFERISWTPPNESPFDDPVYEAIARQVQRHYPGVVVGPVVSPGSTDSQLFRPLGARAYGAVPLMIRTEDAETMHGHNEHVRQDTLATGLRAMFGIVVEVAADPAAVAPPGDRMIAPTAPLPPVPVPGVRAPGG